jgi:hypothetical protein
MHGNGFKTEERRLNMTVKKWFEMQKIGSLIFRREKSDCKKNVRMPSNRRGKESASKRVNVCVKIYAGSIVVSEKQRRKTRGFPVQGQKAEEDLIKDRLRMYVERENDLSTVDDILRDLCEL